MIERLKNSVNYIKKYIPKKDSIKPYIEKIKTYTPKEPLKKLTSNSSIYKNKTENYFKENSVWITIVLIILVCYFFFDFDFLKQKSNKSEENAVTWFKDILLIATTAFGLPFLVWNYKNAYEQKETAKKSLQETENNNRRTQDNKIYMDCITHLANVQETIRTASIHGFGELLGNLENDIKNLSETDIRKQERINFQDKILNVLWSFMVEHSREMLKQKDKDEDEDEYETSQEYKDAKEKINSLYHPQFRFIMELLAKYRPYKKEEDKFWKNKYWTNIYLRMIDLSRANLSGANLRGANLLGASLIEADLRDANLSEANLSEAYLIRAYLSGANLSGATLSEATLSEAKYNNATIFPDGFDKIKHDMTNVDQQQEDAKQQEKSLESAE